MFNVEIIEDTCYYPVTDKRIRATTFRLTYPRFCHAELMTHRVFSRNSSSSRAIPLRKMIRDVLYRPVMPVYWGANQAGMQAKAELTGFKKWLAQQVWRKSRYAAIGSAMLLEKVGLHKQLGNRILEPWMWITVIVTSTDFENFFALRCHPDAQPEIAHLAYMMQDAYHANFPRRLKAGECHIPFVTPQEKLALGLDKQFALSVARCARTSYNIYDANGEQRHSTQEEDFKLYERLLGSSPLHASPAEHQLMQDNYTEAGWAQPHLHGNTTGYIQYRKLLANEYLGEVRA